MTTVTSPATTSAPTTDPTVTGPRLVATGTLLACGAVAGPLWEAVSAIQAATRTGFDITRHPLSVLSTGGLGWLQITNFLLCGVLMILGSVGLHRALRGTPGGIWAPRLIGLSGLGLTAAGALVMDPVPGFGAAGPDAQALGGHGETATMSWHSIGHMAAGSVCFVALAAACFVLGRHFTRSGHRPLAAGSRLAGLAVLLGDGWAMAGGALGSLTLGVGVAVGLIWVAIVAARSRHQL